MKNKKIVLEVILVPLCVLYLMLAYLKSSLAASIIGIVFIGITAIWFAPRYFSEVYTFKSKKNPFKIIVAISDILLFIFSILAVILKLKVLKIISLVLIIISLIHLLYFFFINVKEITKKDKEFAINILYSFFSLLLFALIISSFIIYLK